MKENLNRAMHGDVMIVLIRELIIFNAPNS